MGFEGLDFDGFGAFPMISLKQGTFSCSDGWSLPDPFYAVLMSSRKKFIYKNGLEEKDPNSDFFYSYDQVTAINGDLVEDRLREWRSKGPKTSISRLSAHWANMMATGKPIDSIVTKIGKGPLVKSKGFEFYPIQFEIYNG